MRCKDDTKIFDLEHNLKLLPIDRGFLAVGTGQGRLGNNKFAEINLYIYGTLQ